MKRILVFLFLLATFASAQQADSTDILITVREDGDTTTVGRWRAGMPVLIRESWDGWGEKEKTGNKFVIIRVGIAKARIDSFLVNHSDSTTGLRRKYQLSRTAIQFVKNNRDVQNVVRVTPAQLRNAFKRAQRLRQLGNPQRMGVLTPDLFVRWRNMLIAATETFVTVNTDGGGDYTSLVAAEAGEQKDLVSANEQLTINCSGTAADVDAVFDGWTTDATRKIIWQGNNTTGVWDDTKYRIAGNVTLSVNNTLLKNIYMYSDGTCLLLSAGNCIVTNSYFKGNSTSNNYGIRQAIVATNYIINCVFENFSVGSSAGIRAGFNYVFNMYNCVFYNNNYHIMSHSHGQVINTILSNSITGDFFGAPSSTSSYFLSNNDVSTFPNSITATVNFTDAENGDFRLAVGSPGIDQGADLISEGVTTDIKGVDRPQGAAFDIGAFEFVPTANDAEPEKRNGFNGWIRRGFKGRY